jgi:CheY-like chemotaxis protein
MKILVFEDNLDRQQAMQACLADRFPQYRVQFYDRPSTVAEAFEEFRDEILLISLDHDLELLHGDNGELIDPGTGREVADFLATQCPICPVVIHSSNAAAAVAMQSALEDAGWKTYLVAPYNDLEWIRQAWFRTVRRAIVDSAVPAPE